MADLLDRLEQEAASLPRQSPSIGLASLNPWFYRLKSPERFDEDQRSAHVLKRLAEQSPGARAYHELPSHLAKQVDAYERSPEMWESSYESNAGDYPVYNGFMWAQSLPSAIYATGKMVGNEIDKRMYKALTGEEEKNDVYPEAYDQYQHSANTFTGGVFDPSGPSHWKDVAGTLIEQGNAPKIGYYPSSILDQRIANENAAKAQEIEDGRTYLDRARVHPYVSRTLGPLMDAFLSFPSSLPSLSRIPVYKSANWWEGPARTALSALAEVGPDVALANPDIPLRAGKKYAEGKLPWEE